MDYKSKIRAATRCLINILHSEWECVEMSITMDGSGELGGVIYREGYRRMRDRLDAVLYKLNLSIEEYKEIIDQWATLQMYKSCCIGENIPTHYYVSGVIRELIDLD